jgi:hypothetical protein
MPDERETAAGQDDHGCNRAETGTGSQGERFQVAAEASVDFLGSIPVDPAVVVDGEVNVPHDHGFRLAVISAPAGGGGR